MNTFVIGDVHGCYNTLLNLINKLPKNCDLIFVGDLVDRGKHSREVVEFITRHDYRCVKGNHEEYMIKHLEDVLFNDKKDLDWLKPGWGGEATISSYKGSCDVTIKKHLSWLKSLPSYFLIDNKYFITHGFGLPYFKRRNNSDIKIQNALTSNRVDIDKYNDQWEDFSDYEVINIFGHCKFDEILLGNNYYGIDTGCSYGGKLTAIELGSMQIIQEPLDKADVFTG